MRHGDRAARSVPFLVALAALWLSGCSDEQFRELMLTLAFGVVVIAVASILVSVVNLTVLGGGIATIAINRFGHPTHRSRTLGFVFGGLNIATGITGMLGALSMMFVFHDQLIDAMRPTDGSLGPAPDLFLGGLLGLAVSAGALALGAAGIFVAAKCEPVDLVPRPRASPPT
ncbi:MAG: hypothetical protein K1X94_20220 [Sandaracinaceae bacterium]|nr:hypothetical protein [Sandaracinaceae bacterium]